jgi:hypothetical protein
MTIRVMPGEYWQLSHLLMIFNQAGIQSAASNWHWVAAQDGTQVSR